ncbi:hypothetical protein [Collinsella ihumii]|uniref:hypothetical protein n=1 Tax=Collinsella ihumii TaxID=1720204 RepID=UPI0025AA6A3E|nr:hypothetical protein [Collinsella ihumii]MDN0055080.1 hypothetical protein [Collinsella ihumii]
MSYGALTSGGPLHSSTGVFEYTDAIQKLLLCMASALLIVGDNRFWMSISTWANGNGSLIAGGAVLLSGTLLIVNTVRERQPLRAEFLLPVFAYLLTIGVWTRFGLDGTMVANRDIAMVLPIYAILCLSRDDKIRLLYSVAMVFSIVMGLAAIFFLTRYLGGSFPFFELESSNPLKTVQGMYYEISMLGGVLLNRYGNLTYCGVFDEAGCAGTFAALLFIAVNECKEIDSFRYSRAIKAILIIEGALSFSFAFFLMLAAYLAICLFRKGNVKLAGAVAALLMLTLFVIVVEPERLGSFVSLQRRTVALFSGEGLLNNRVNVQTDEIMRRFYGADDLLVSLFGYGRSAFNDIASAAGVDGCSVEFYLYDYGYVGIIFYYVLIAVLNRCSGRSMAGCWVPLLFFLISTYQRPEVMTSLYLAILMLGFIPSKESETRFVEKTIARSRVKRINDFAARREAA